MRTLAILTGLCIVTSLGLTAPARADTASCKSGCTNTYQNCVKSKSEDACLGSWMQCKKTCDSSPIGMSPIAKGSSNAVPAPASTGPKDKSQKSSKAAAPASKPKP